MTQKYKRMIDGIRSEGEVLLGNWNVYILRCADRTLYTGVTNNMELRLKMHNAKKAAKYTATRGPVTLVYHENSMTRGEALRREYVIKRLPKAKKEALL